jgi:two-component system, LytTR family, sensor kinase
VDTSLRGARALWVLFHWPAFPKTTRCKGASTNTVFLRGSIARYARPRKMSGTQAPCKLVDEMRLFVALPLRSNKIIRNFAFMSAQWYTKKWVAISLHVVFWALFFAYPFLLRPVMGNHKPGQNVFNNSSIYVLITLNNFLRMLLFYTNAYVLIPKLIYRKKTASYGLVVVMALGVLLAFDWLFVSLLFPDADYRVLNFFAFNLPVFILIIIASAAYRIIRDRVEENQRNKERETENLKTELSFLRSQVSPHFMFNVLNNMVALARKKSDALEPSLIKLSQLLRYMLYETDEDKVLLEKEVEYLQSYIDLQKQRFGKNVAIRTCLQNVENGYTIEPMLLIPFVENAFKHGTGMILDAEIDVHLQVQAGVLDFSVRNKFAENTASPKDKTSGIGLNNVKRRLNLLYRNSHSLRIEKKDGWFTINLQLNLH